MVLVCPQCRLSECEMDQIALRQATSATVRDVVHACQPTNAGHIVLTDESEQCFTKRSNKCFFRCRQRGVGCLTMQEHFKQLSGGGCAPRCRECHHSMHDVKRSRTCECLRLPVIGQILPACPDLDNLQPEPPKQGRRIGEDGHARNVGIHNLCIIGRECRGGIIQIELKQGAMPG